MPPMRANCEEVPMHTLRTTVGNSSAGGQSETQTALNLRHRGKPRQKPPQWQTWLGKQGRGSKGWK
eukprot:scaffold657835_cov60-Prasinocladus_malaysianus.AAC.1